MDAGPRERQLAQGVPVQGQAREGNGYRRPVQDVPVQGEPNEGNGNRCECRPAVDQRAAVHLRHRRARRSPTTIDAPTKARTPTPTVTHHRFSGGRPRTLPLRPCCCAAARSLQPPRSDECASS
jgi:hypothetical protein